MPDGILSFGFLSIPGRKAAHLKLEIENANLAHQPDALCVLAPSNNLSASRPVSEAGADFAKLMTTVTKRFPNVFVLDFPPRLNCEVEDQDLLRQEFRDVTARMDVKYYSIAEYFPLQDRKLWVRDGVHLSDDGGMKILVKWLAHHSYQVSFPPSLPIVTPAPKPQRSPPTRRTTITPEPNPQVSPLLPSTPAVKPLVSPKPSLLLLTPAAMPLVSQRPSVPTCTPNIPRQPDLEWSVVGRGRKRQQPGQFHSSCNAPKRTLLHHQEVLKECSVLLNPLRFSRARLAEMNKISPSHLPSRKMCTPASPQIKKRRPPGQPRRRILHSQDEVKDCSVPLTPARSSLVPLVKMDDTTPLNVPSPKECTQVTPHITEVDTSPTSTEVTARSQPTGVLVDVKKEVQAAPGAEETAGSSSTGVPKEAISIKMQTVQVDTSPPE